MSELVSDYCESETFQASCSGGEVILVTSAVYGRMEIGRCISQSFGYIGCKVDVMDVMDGYCSGETICEVGASNRHLVSKKTESCPKDVAAYLSASFQCIKGLFSVI